MADEARILELLEAALEPGMTPEQVCADDPELLAEVRRRWEACQIVSADLDRLFSSAGEGGGAGGAARRTSGPEPLPDVPGYRVEAVLGRGGMGVVHRAVDLRLRRPVAIKTLLAGGYASRSELVRFLGEARAIASLRHPHVVQVYDAGEHDGRPYFTMELVEGGTLAERIGGVPMPPMDAAKLLVAVAGAVEAAHRAGIVHRDLKPGNVLLMRDGTPKVSDFGLAVQSTAAGGDGLTLTGQRLGTPSYMAPEQASPRFGRPGPAADVYSLGAILYETLTGRPPFLGDSASETERQLLAEDPVWPTRLNARVPRDLETICLKCLEKDPARRYRSAAELAADLERFLNDEPILAVPISWVGHTARWVRRHRSLATALAAVAALLMLLTVGSLGATAYFRRLEQQQRMLADENARVADEKEVERGRAVSAERRATELRRQAEDESQALRRHLYFNQMNLAGQAALSPSGVGRVIDWLQPWAVSQPDLRGWEWYYLNGLCHRATQTWQTVNAIMHVAWSGGRVASAGADGTVILWDAATGRELRRLVGRLVGDDLEIGTVAWSPDGRRLATAGWDGLVRIWNADTGEVVTTFRQHTGSVFSVAWHPDGQRVASISADRTLLVWDAATGKVAQRFDHAATPIADVAWSPDGTRLAAVVSEMDVGIFDVASAARTLTLHGHRNLINRIAWSPDGRRLATASNDRTARIWETTTGQATTTLNGHAMSVRSVDWSPEGTHVATGGDDQTVMVWRASGGAALQTLRGHTARVTAVDWSPDGSRIISASLDASIRHWDAGVTSNGALLAGHAEPVLVVAWSPDGRRLVSAGLDKAVHVWDVEARRVLFTLGDRTESVRAIAWSPDGARIAVGGSGHTIRLYDAESGQPSGTWRQDAEWTYGLAWSPDARKLASAGGDGVARVWDVGGGEEVQRFAGHSGAVFTLAWSPDGTRLASGSHDRTVRIWDAGSGKQIRSLGGHESEINSVAWSPDGRHVVSAGNDQVVRVWDAVGGNPIRSLRGHTTRVTGVAWSPDRARLASSSDDRTVKVWDAASGRETLTLDCDASMVHAVAWRPDGLALASAGEDNHVRIHDAAPGYASARSVRYLPELDRRLAADPSDVASRQLRAEIYARRGRWDEAAADARQILSRAGDRRWVTVGYWVTGPYPADLDVPQPPEQTTELTGDWRTRPLDANGFVNFGGLFGATEQVSCYAMLRVYAPARQEVAMLIGSDDQMRLWLNGQRVYTARDDRAAVPATDVVTVHLKGGWNTVLARVANDRGKHALYLRLSDDPADLARGRSNGVGAAP